MTLHLYRKLHRWIDPSGWHAGLHRSPRGRLCTWTSSAPRP